MSTPLSRGAAVMILTSIMMAFVACKPSSNATRGKAPLVSPDLPEHVIPRPFSGISDCGLTRMAEPTFDCATSAFDPKHRGGIFATAVREVDDHPLLLTLIAFFEVDEHGEAFTCHGCPTRVELAIFDLTEKNRIRLVARAPDAALTSGFLQVSFDERPYIVANGEPAIGVRTETMYQGFSSENLALFRLLGSKLTPVFDEWVGSGNHPSFDEEYDATTTEDDYEVEVEPMRPRGSPVFLRLLTRRFAHSDIYHQSAVSLTFEDRIWDETAMQYRPVAPPASASSSPPSANTRSDP